MGSDKTPNLLDRNRSTQLPTGPGRLKRVVVQDEGSTKAMVLRDASPGSDPWLGSSAPRITAVSASAAGRVSMLYLSYTAKKSI